MHDFLKFKIECTNSYAYCWPCSCCSYVHHMKTFLHLLPSSPAHLLWPHSFQPWSDPPCCLWMESVDRKQKPKGQRERFSQRTCHVQLCSHCTLQSGTCCVYKHIFETRCENTHRACVLYEVPFFPYHTAQSRSIVMEAPYYHMFLSLAYCLKITHFKPSIKLVLSVCLLSVCTPNSSTAYTILYQKSYIQPPLF